MAAALRIGDVLAARLGRPRPGTFQRAPRTLFDERGEGQHPSHLSDDPRADFSCAAPASAAQMAQTARGDDAEEFAAAPAGRFNAGRFGEREFSARYSGRGWRCAPACWRGACTTGFDVLGKDLLRTFRRARGAQ